MIDLDWLDEQLEQALSDEVRCARRGHPGPEAVPARPAASPPTRSRPPSRSRGPAVVAVPDAPAPARRPSPPRRPSPATPAPPSQVLPLGDSGRPADPTDAAARAAVRALLDGREADARAAAEQVLALGREAGHPDTWTRYLTLYFRIVLEWGSEDEQDELLEQCRARAYWFDEIPWRAALTLLLARLGKVDEAAREFDLTLARGRAAGVPADTWRAVVTDLADAAAVLGDSQRASVAQRARAA